MAWHGITYIYIHIYVYTIIDLIVMLHNMHGMAWHNVCKDDLLPRRHVQYGLIDCMKTDNKRQTQDTNTCTISIAGQHRTSVTQDYCTIWHHRVHHRHTAKA